VFNYSEQYCNFGLGSGYEICVAVTLFLSVCALLFLTKFYWS
jgi:hypothetical protein